jgi:hypothetical protein
MLPQPPTIDLKGQHHTATMPGPLSAIVNHGASHEHVTKLCLFTFRTAAPLAGRKIERGGLEVRADE